MKKFCIFLLAIVFNVPLHAQWITIDRAVDNINEANLTYTYNLSNMLRNTVYDDGNVQVKAVVTRNSSTPTPSFAIYFRRTVAGVTTSGSLPVPLSSTNDLVIGDGGNKILYVAMEAASVNYRAYQFIGGTYALINSGTIAQAVHNPPMTVMLYGGPRLSIDQNDNVVVFYHSFDDNLDPYLTDVIHEFARTGDINGNWTTYPNIYNAFIVDQGLSLPNHYKNGFSDVGMTKYASNDMVTFVFPVDNLNGVNYLHLAQISYNDLAANNASALNYHLLASSTTEKFEFPSVDGAAIALQPSISDDWVVAYDEVHNGRNDIRVAKGTSGSFITYPYISTQLQFDRQLGPPEIQYYTDFIGLAFSSNDTVHPCKRDWDPLYVQLDQNGALPSPKRYIRLNNGRHLIGDQRALSFSTPVNGSYSPYVSFFDQVGQEIIESPLDPFRTCGEVQDDDGPIDDTRKSSSAKQNGATLQQIEVFALDGRLIKSFEGDADLQSLPHGIYVVLRYYSDGSVETKKEAVLRKY